MFGALIDYLIGFCVGRGIANTGRTARSAALAAERAGWSEARKIAFERRAAFLKGERRFVFTLFAVILGAAWLLGALFG